MKVHIRSNIPAFPYLLATELESLKEASVLVSSGGRVGCFLFHRPDFPGSMGAG